MYLIRQTKWHTEKKKREREREIHVDDTLQRDSVYV